MPHVTASIDQTTDRLLFSSGNRTSPYLLRGLRLDQFQATFSVTRTTATNGNVQQVGWVKRSGPTTPPHP